MVVPAYGSGKRAREALTAAESVIDKRAVGWMRVGRWSKFQTALPHAWVAVVAVEPGDLQIWTRLRALSQTARASIIVLTPPGFRTPAIGGIHVMSSAPTTLSSKLAWKLYEVRAASFFGDQAVRIDRCPALSALMKRFIDVALLAEPPLATVEALAERGRRSTQDVWYHWRREALAGTPKELLMWIVLVRAVLRRPSGASWARVGRKVGANRQRLSRTARSVLDMSLDEAAADGGEFAMRRFAQYLTDCLGLRDDYEGTQTGRLWASATAPQSRRLNRMNRS